MPKEPKPPDEQPFRKFACITYERGGFFGLPGCL